ncbi:alpha/beta fold hydrolase [Mycobacterium camsae]|uniref:alpha/beta fold hydrolase n=1 Tax=Mycobacterium gordonae TaxID=1778 RepID=UPI001F1196BD|nr:alpha/beta hydrolase [Mycobacterium gordonae]
MPDPNATVGQSNYTERSVLTRDGVRLAVRDYGRRQPLHTVVLMHGLCLTQDSWAIQIRQLTSRWGSALRIVSYDHRGHGRSTGAPTDTYRVERLAADLADVLQALRVTGPVTLAGHSLGGMTALAYLSLPAAARPVQPESLVLVAAAAGRISERGLGRLLASPTARVLFDLVNRMPRRPTESTIRCVIRPLRAALARYCGRDIGHTGFASLATESTRAVAPATAAGFLLNLGEYDVYHALPSIDAATVVVSGGADITTPDAHARDLVAAIPGAMYVQQPGAGHMLLLEAPHCVTTAINRAMGLHRNPAWTAASWAMRYGLPDAAAAS